MILELARALSFFLSVLSLYPVLVSAFFVPGTRWQERLAACLFHAGFAACVCFASGMLFIWPSRAHPRPTGTLLSTLPVRIFFCGMAGMAVLFALGWYLEENFVPWMRHDCCRP